MVKKQEEVMFLNISDNFNISLKWACLKEVHSKNFVVYFKYNTNKQSLILCGVDLSIAVK